MAIAALDCPRPGRTDPPGTRLQQYLAQCGLGSRRACEFLIAAGRVSVGGEIVAVQGRRVRPGVDVVRVDGHIVRPQPKLYLLFNKPRDVICTSRDPRDRRVFLAFLPGIRERLFSVGRLDRESEGLLILTNDGAFAQLLGHPRHHVPKMYTVEIVGGVLASPQLRQMREGVFSEGELLRATDIVLEHAAGDRARYRVTLVTGRNRQLRRMFAVLGRPVLCLRRVAIGPVTIRGLARGAWRHLDRAEINGLCAAAQGDAR